MNIFFIIFGLLPSFAWLIFFIKEDSHPEPKKIIAKVFIAGALMAIFAAVFQFLLRDVFNSFQIKELGFFSFSAFAIIEEIFKFLAAYLIIRKNNFFDEPIDAMIYMITAALGFAIVENIGVAMSISNFQEVIVAITLRFVGATLLHALSSGIVGYYWAKWIIRKNNAEYKREIFIKLLFQGIAIASLLHAIFNYLILISREQILIYPTIFLIIIALFVFWDFEKIKSNRE
ncbi:MAG: PrsW family intramembrane metalloprotease [Patescibacteria group bacterium]